VRTRQRTPWVIGLAVVALVLLSAVAWAADTSQSASTGGVTATFSYTGSGANVRNLHLTIVRGGETAYDQPVTSPNCRPPFCGPGAFGANSRSVRVIRLAPGGQPDVVLELFSGGANCCFIDQVFSYSPIVHGYLKTEHEFASYGASLRRLGSAHRWRFVTGDDSFKYQFTDGADSGEPIQIWSFSGRGFVDVTRRYPNLIAADAARWLRLFQHHLSNGVGLIAAWAADEELLGHDKRVQSVLATEARRHDLRDGGGGLATGKRFITKLNRFLHRLGYRH
jgi:hypothetical protein